MVTQILWGVALIAVGFCTGLWVGRRLKGPQEKDPGTITKQSEEPVQIPVRDLDSEKSKGAGSAPGTAGQRSLDKLVAAANSAYYEAYHPSQLLENPAFQEGVSLLAGEAYSNEQLLEYCTGLNPAMTFMAIEALARREWEAGILDRILPYLNELPYTRFFVLRTLSAKRPPTERLIPKVLVSLDKTWHDRENHPVDHYHHLLRKFIQERLDQGEQPDFTVRQMEGMPEQQMSLLENLLARLGIEPAGPLLLQLKLWRKTRIDFDFLRSVGKVWSRKECEDPFLVEHETLLRDVDRLEGALEKKPPRSILLVGEPGVGKTSLLRLLGKRLTSKGWTVFEAGHSELLAGQIWVGSLEERVRTLKDRLGGERKIVWFVPDFHALQWTGQHMKSDYSVLDSLIPEMENGTLIVVGETQTGPFESLLLAKPQLLRAMDVLRLPPLSRAETLELARAWARQAGGEQPVATEEIIEEAWQLSDQYLRDRGAPGNLFELLELTRERLSAEPGRGQGAITLTANDLIRTLARLTGLPHSILDDRLRLDLKELRTFFLSRVMGQQEAVDCLVERVAMIKAGLTDPNRPQGVFLFAGPTGTGKTEMAKALAEYLFGSPDRLIRLDMSEFQTPESLQRLQGDLEGKTETALVHLIRKEPFSVILLDEFEKANPNVWDLFLQVFDNGRLTDRRGNTADFRHAIIIMTSNLGAVIPTGTSLGFARETGRFDPKDVERAIHLAFRKEFLNRIDRIVVFKSLAGETMRRILLKELEDVLRRRGLRTRSWAVEWDDSAIEFLLEQGFTSDMGARPLKRAIEEHVLTRLATTIVDHDYPQGDQFLFVRSDGRSIQVEFIDPDAPDEAVADEAPAAGREVRPGPSRPEEVALDPLGTPEEIALLRSCFARLEEQIQAEDWQQAKARSLAMTSEPGFWEDPGRFSVLGRIEVLDRIETGLASAGSLLARLEGSTRSRRNRYSGDLVRKVAERLFLLDRACTGFLNGQPQDAFLLVESGGADTAREDLATEEFAHRLGAMYERWASERAMKTEVLEKRSNGEARLSRVMLAVSGYGAYPVLSAENGLHVLASPADKGRSNVDRVKVRVRVVPQPDEPVGIVHKTALEQAREAFAARPAADLVVVRRYRKEPSPLVRDSVRGWRTGRWDKVFAGNFDLMTAGKD
jgi:ATP-dependent Clp protease ATP-binding subunit ClpC